jgi:hypothetical protein
MGKSLIQKIMTIGDLPESRAVQIVNLVLDHVTQAPEGKVRKERLWTADGDQEVIVMSFDGFLAGKPARDLFEAEE